MDPGLRLIGVVADATLVAWLRGTEAWRCPSSTRFARAATRARSVLLNVSRRPSERRF